MREVLGKKLSKGTKKDLDDISTKTGITLKSCRRQVDTTPICSPPLHTIPLVTAPALASSSTYVAGVSHLPPPLFLPFPSHPPLFSQRTFQKPRSDHSFLLLVTFIGSHSPLDSSHALWP